MQENDSMTRKSRTLVRNSHIFDLYEDVIEMPDGREVMFDFLKHKGASAVVPVMEDGRIIMVRQYRPAVDRYTLEIPAGGRNSTEEDFLVAAARELEEETGYVAGSMEHIISIRTAVAFSNEQIEVFVARDLTKKAQRLDEDEYIDIAAYDIEDLMDRIYSCRIQDAKTIAALLAYRNKIRG